MADLGLAHKESGGRFRITSLGTQTYEKYEELRKFAILEFLAEQDRPVREAEIARYVDGVDDELFDEALNEVKKQLS